MLLGFILVEGLVMCGICASIPQYCTTFWWCVRTRFSYILLHTFDEYMMRFVFVKSKSGAVDM